MERLSASDAAFLYAEESTRPQQSGTLAVFDGAPAFDADRLLALVRTRVAASRRYRQRVLTIPGRLATPVWVDDEAFDLAFHLRRSGLPPPGTDTELHALVARVMSRPLDHTHPLWELYVIEGLADDRFALLVKTHHALVDGVTTLDLAQLLLDESPDAAPAHGGGTNGAWRAEAVPSRTELVAEALADAMRRPKELAQTVRATYFPDVRTSARTVTEAVGNIAVAVRNAAWPPTGPAPLDAAASGHRVYATADHDLDDYKAIRAHFGGSVNDVLLATVTGALREWLQTRGEPVASRATIRAIVPVSVREPGDQPGSGLGDGQVGMRVSSYPVDLPVGEPSPVMRLHQIGYATQAHKESGHAIGADALVQVAGFAAPTLHALGARVASTLSRHSSNLVVTNVPGPQRPMYAAGSRLAATYPVSAVAAGQAVSVGITSYDGGVYYGLNADADAMPDVEVFARCLSGSLDELRAAVDE